MAELAAVGCRASVHVVAGHGSVLGVGAAEQALVSGSSAPRCRRFPHSPASSLVLPEAPLGGILAPDSSSCLSLVWRRLSSAAWGQANKTTTDQGSWLAHLRFMALF